MALLSVVERLARTLEIEMRRLKADSTAVRVVTKLAIRSPYATKPRLRNAESLMLRGLETFGWGYAVKH